jgi:hypothetical protein
MNFQEGCFLVRTSTTHHGAYVLSLAHQGRPLHFKINADHSGRVSFDEGPTFGSLAELVVHYRGYDAECLLPTTLAAGCPCPAEQTAVESEINSVS